MVKVKRHTEGDSRVAKEVPTFEDFMVANRDHRDDVRNLTDFFIGKLRQNAINHDWTKVSEPYKSMFYRDLCNTIEGRMEFFDGEWSRLHYTELERHHLARHCPDDVTMLDVLEMIFDCVAAGMARNGNVTDVDIPPEILTKAVRNTVEYLKENIELS